MTLRKSRGRGRNRSNRGGGRSFLSSPCPCLPFIRLIQPCVCVCLRLSSANTRRLVHTMVACCVRSLSLSVSLSARRLITRNGKGGGGGGGSKKEKNGVKGKPADKSGVKRIVARRSLRGLKPVRLLIYSLVPIIVLRSRKR